MPLRSYLELVEQESPPQGMYYLAETPIRTALPELEADIPIPPVLRRAATGVLFLGRDTFSACHFHYSRHALLCVVAGTKNIRLVAPRWSASLRPNAWHSPRSNFARTNPFRPHGGTVRCFEEVVVHECSLRRGDALYIPVHWWHAVESPGFSAAVTFFWPAPLRHWSFPTPGLRALAHVAAVKGRERLRVARRRRAAHPGQRLAPREDGV
jgi:hypothetical protein